MLELLTGETAVNARSGGGTLGYGSTKPEIDEFETLILWAMRQWMRAHKDRCCATSWVLEAFEFSGFIGALAPLNRMMTLLTLASRRRLAIATAPAAPISIDELVLLRVLHAARHGQRDLAESRLGMWMNAGEAVAATSAALQLTEAVYRPGIKAHPNT